MSEQLINYEIEHNDKQKSIRGNHSIIKRAFLVDINYRGSEFELHGCINDVLAVKAMLIDHYGYLEENILLLSDDTIVKPTAANIINGWKWLISKRSISHFNPGREAQSQAYLPLTSSDNANLYFHYSGHGSQVRDTNGDEIDGKDETICPIDFLTAGMISDDIMRVKLANKVPANNKLVAVIDACHSESSFDLLWTVKSNMILGKRNKVSSIGEGFPSLGKLSLTKTGKYLPTEGEVIMLSGCRDNETSADVQIEGKGQGALTYSLVKILENSKYDITYNELLTKVRSFIKTNHLSTQIPCLSFGKWPISTFKGQDNVSPVKFTNSSLKFTL
ncbi:Caspase [uncultured virus]|nr:Caspase [uncultured virus]